MDTPDDPRTRRKRARSPGSGSAERAGAHDNGANVRIASAEGREGVIRFVLRRVAGGLYVERDELPRKGTRTSISVEFKDRDGFGRWCDSDPSRFDSPLLHQRVRRAADELWEFDG
ncbi:MAG: hypothetical protein HS128_11805 [Ideonella sp.]|nr:hypothetical protein [Ideonella sp.]MCC7458030.1 hypothetical protein [Nitrospira sp.]